MFAKLPFERNTKIPRTSLIIILLISFMFGLWIARYELNIYSWLLIVPILLLPTSFKRSKYSLIIVMLAGLSLGLIRGGMVWADYAQYEQLAGSQVTIRGQVIDDSSYSDNGQTDFHISRAELDGKRLPGKIRVSGFTSPYGVKRGDSVQIKGKLRDGFGSYQASVSFATIKVTKRQDDLISNLRAQFFAGVYTALPEPQSSLGLGFLVGLRALLPEDLLNQLSRTGLTHIVAVSGYNLTVLVRFARRNFMWISKFSATAISVGLMIFFLAVTGLAPSIFRASIVSGFALAAWYYGRPIRPLMLLGLSGAITAGLNPFFIWFDLGWWLSFTAFFGVLVLAPTFTQRFFKKEGKDLSMPVQIAIETTSAQIMALPIIMVIFGELSLISIIANILVIPFIPIAMAFTFVAGVAGAIAPPGLLAILAVPAKVMLVAMTSVIAMLSSIPWALIEVNIGWSTALIWYVGVLFIYLVMYKHLSDQQKVVLTNTNHLE
jgi:ComEC/Rec2-related protein